MCSHYRSRCKGLCQNKKHEFYQYTKGGHFCAAHMALMRYKNNNGISKCYWNIRKKIRHVFLKHGCPRRQQSQNMAKISKSYILTPLNPQGHVMSVKCEEPIDELTVQVWLLYHHQNFEYCTLFVSRTNYGQTEAVYANYIGLSVMTDANCEGFTICDDRITENDQCVIKIIGIHWDRQTEGQTNGRMIRLLDAPGGPFRPGAQKQCYKCTTHE